MTKKKKLRHSEYYDLQPTFDKLYADSQNGKIFINLLEIISCEENIRLAYRNIKKNGGSNTAGTDKLTIKDIENMSVESFVKVVQRKFMWYKPKPVKRVEIPKPNGKMRPLGIPTIIDRLVQQCILQVLEPICEAKFFECSNGFRPNRSVEQAIAQCYKMIQLQNLHFVVDVDIKGFFDNVNHSKLIKQIWHLGISEEKSKIVNLKRHYSEFLGFELKAVKKRKGYFVRSHMTKRQKLKEQRNLLSRLSGLPIHKTEMMKPKKLRFITQW